MSICLFPEKKDVLPKDCTNVNNVKFEGITNQSTQSFYEPGDIREAVFALRAELANLSKPPTNPLTVQQLFEVYIRAKKLELKQSTIQKTTTIFQCHIKPYFATTRLTNLSPSSLQEWKLSLPDSLATTIKRNAYTVFSALLNYSVKMEYLEKNPLRAVGQFRFSSSEVKRFAYYTTEEFLNFITAAKKRAVESAAVTGSDFEWNYYVFFNIAFYTGLRKGEIHGLEWDDIQDGFLSISRSVSQKIGIHDLVTSPKNRSSVRTIQLPMPLQIILAEHRERQKVNGLYRGNSRILGSGRALRDSTISSRNKTYAELAEVKCIRIHDFRHSHASLLVNAGINIQEVSRRLGHSKIEITWNVYAHLYPREQEKAIEVLNAVHC